MRIGLVVSSGKLGSEMREMKILFKLFEKGPTKGTLIHLESAIKSKNAQPNGAEEAGEYRKALKFANLAKKLKLDVCIYRDFYQSATLTAAKTILKNRLKLVFIQESPSDYLKADPLNVFRANQLDAWVSPLNATANEVRALTQVPQQRIHIIQPPIQLAGMKGAGDLKSKFRKDHAIGADQLIVGIQLDAGLSLPKEVQTLMRSLKRSALLRQRLFLFIEWHGGLEGEGESIFQELTTALVNMEMRQSFIQVQREGRTNEQQASLDIALIIADGEPYRLKAWEAMERGIYCIASATQVTAELLRNGEYGWLYSRGSEDSMLEAFGYILRHVDEKQTPLAKPIRMKRPAYAKRLLEIMSNLTVKA